MLAFVALGVAVLVLIVVNEWSIRSVRASRRRELAADIERLEILTGIVEEPPWPTPMTNEPGQIIQLEEAPVWGPSPMDMAVARYLREDDPPPASASIPQWYEEYRKKLIKTQLYRDDSENLEVW